MRVSIVLSALIISSTALSIRQNNPGVELMSKRQGENHDGGHTGTPDHPSNTDPHTANDNPAQHGGNPVDSNNPNHNPQTANDNPAQHGGDVVLNPPQTHDDPNSHASNPATNGTSNHDVPHTGGNDTAPTTSPIPNHDPHTANDDPTQHGTPATNGTSPTGEEVKPDPSDKCSDLCVKSENVYTSCHQSNVDSLECHCRTENLAALENCASCRTETAGGDKQAQSTAEQLGSQYLNIRDQCVKDKGTKVTGNPKVTVTVTTSVNVAQVTPPAGIVKTIVVKGGSSNAASKDKCSSECKKSRKVYDSCPKDKDVAGCFCQDKNLVDLEDCASCRKKNVGNNAQANSTANALIDQFIGIRQFCIQRGTKVSSASLKVTATTTISVNPAQITAPTGIVERR